jgi:hypothetical protein
MKYTPKETDIKEILFSFDTSEEEEEKQIEFLYGYYVAKLRLLRNGGPEKYITKEQEDKEVLYKDMITSCASYIYSLKFKRINNEGNNQESGSIP